MGGTARIGGPQGLNQKSYLALEQVVKSDRSRVRQLCAIDSEIVGETAHNLMEKAGANLSRLQNKMAKWATSSTSKQTIFKDLRDSAKKADQELLQSAKLIEEKIKKIKPTTRKDKALIRELLAAKAGILNIRHDLEAMEHVLIDDSATTEPVTRAGEEPPSGKTWDLEKPEDLLTLGVGHITEMRVQHLDTLLEIGQLEERERLLIEGEAPLSEAKELLNLYPTFEEAERAFLKGELHSTDLKIFLAVAYANNQVPLTLFDERLLVRIAAKWDNSQNLEELLGKDNQLLALSLMRREARDDKEATLKLIAQKASLEREGIEPAEPWIASLLSEEFVENHLLVQAVQHLMEESDKSFNLTALEKLAGELYDEQLASIDQALAALHAGEEPPMNWAHGKALQLLRANGLEVWSKNHPESRALVGTSHALGQRLFQSKELLEHSPGEELRISWSQETARSATKALHASSLVETREQREALLRQFDLDPEMEIGQVQATILQERSQLMGHLLSLSNTLKEQLGWSIGLDQDANLNREELLESARKLKAEGLSPEELHLHMVGGSPSFRILRELLVLDGLGVLPLDMADHAIQEKFLEEIIATETFLSELESMVSEEHTTTELYQLQRALDLILVSLGEHCSQEVRRVFELMSDQIDGMLHSRQIKEIEEQVTKELKSFQKAGRATKRNISLKVGVGLSGVGDLSVQAVGEFSVATGDTGAIVAKQSGGVGLGLTVKALSIAGVELGSDVALGKGVLFESVESFAAYLVRQPFMRAKVQGARKAAIARKERKALRLAEPTEKKAISEADEMANLFASRIPTLYHGDRDKLKPQKRSTAPLPFTGITATGSGKAKSSLSVKGRTLADIEGSVAKTHGIWKRQVPLNDIFSLEPDLLRREPDLTLEVQEETDTQNLQTVRSVVDALNLLQNERVRYGTLIRERRSYQTVIKEKQKELNHLLSLAKTSESMRGRGWEMRVEKYYGKAEKLKVALKAAKKEEKQVSAKIAIMEEKRRVRKSGTIESGKRWMKGKKAVESEQQEQYQKALLRSERKLLERAKAIVTPSTNQMEEEEELDDLLFNEEYWRLRAVEEGLSVRISQIIDTERSISPRNTLENSLDQEALDYLQQGKEGSLEDMLCNSPLPSTTLKVSDEETTRVAQLTERHTRELHALAVSYFQAIRKKDKLEDSKNDSKEFQEIRKQVQRFEVAYLGDKTLKSKFRDASAKRKQDRRVEFLRKLITEHEQWKLRYRDIATPEEYEEFALSDSIQQADALYRDPDIFLSDKQIEALLANTSYQEKSVAWSKGFTFTPSKATGPIGVSITSTYVESDPNPDNEGFMAEISITVAVDWQKYGGKIATKLEEALLKKKIMEEVKAEALKTGKNLNTILKKRLGKLVLPVLTEAIGVKKLPQTVKSDQQLGEAAVELKFVYGQKEGEVTGSSTLDAFDSLLYVRARSVLVTGFSAEGIPITGPAVMGGGVSSSHSHCLWEMIGSDCLDIPRMLLNTWSRAGTDQARWEELTASQDSAFSKLYQNMSDPKTQARKDLEEVYKEAIKAHSEDAVLHHKARMERALAEVASGSGKITEQLTARLNNTLKKLIILARPPLSFTPKKP